MKLKNLLPGAALLLLFSCATTQTPVAPPIAPPAEPPHAELPHAPIEPAPHIIEAELPIPTLFDAAVTLVRRNPPELEKYFFLDANREIVIMSELFELSGISEDGLLESEIFEVHYHIEHFQTLGIEGFRGAFIIPFTLRSVNTGHSRQDLLLWRPERDASGILLSFDDDYFDNWEYYFYLFDFHRARVTFFIQGSLSPPEHRSGEFEQRSVELYNFAQAALERGHDIGFHSVSHPDLRWLSIEDFRDETIGQVPHFADAGILLSSFAYPYGFFEDWMHDELYSAFDILRGYGVTFRLYSPSEISNNFISSRAIDSILFREDEAFYRAVSVMLITVKLIGGNTILPLTTHIISDEADWGITPERLSYLLLRANELELNFYIYNDFTN